jgi:pimeloyl-ACP methyl ester carboxylesterase
MKSHLIHYAKGLVGQYYQTEGNKKLLIWIWWAPSLPSSPDKEALIVSQSGFDLVRPEFYGYARSSWIFSPKNCIQTVYDTIQVYKQQLPILSIYEDQELLTPIYDEIVIVWHSYGWWITAAMPKFDEIVKEIVLLAPWFAPDDLNQLWYSEETDEEFLRQCLLWYKSIYRFGDDIDPYDGLINIWALNPINDISHLRDVKVFVWHGSADDVIWCGRSKAFVDQLKDMNPDGHYHYAEYYWLWHGWICKEAALRWRLHRRKQFES